MANLVTTTFLNSLGSLGPLENFDFPVEDRLVHSHDIELDIAHRPIDCAFAREEDRFTLRVNCTLWRTVQDFDLAPRLANSFLSLSLEILANCKDSNSDHCNN